MYETRKKKAEVFQKSHLASPKKSKSKLKERTFYGVLFSYHLILKVKYHQYTTVLTLI